MLVLLLQCPVTVERLKKTDTAKLVKGLRKEGNCETVVALASRLYEKWLLVIGAAAVPSSAAADSRLAEIGNRAPVPKTKKIKQRKVSVDGNDSSSSSNGGDGVAASAKAGQGLAVAPQTNKLKSGLKTRDGVAEANGSLTTTATTTGPILTPSDSFMNAVTAVLHETPKRKKKLSASDTDPSVHKKTKVDPLTVPLTPAADPIDDTLSRIIEQDMSNKNTLTPEFNRSLSDLPVTPTTSSTSSMMITPESLRPFATSTPNPLLAAATPAGDMTPGPDKSFPRGCLHYGSSSVKKKVRWLPDESMTRVKFFDSGKDERVNVWRQQMQEQNESKLAEGQAFKDRSMNDSNSGDGQSSAKVAWFPLVTIDVPDANVRGRSSTEKITEAKRQSETLADIYVSKELCPDSPAEPDVTLQSVPIAQMRMIPLDDPASSFYDFSMKPLPAPRNNPLFGETFLQPHQMALDHHVMSPGPGVQPSLTSPQPAAGPGIMFASSYVERPFAGNPNMANGTMNRVNGGFPNNRNNKNNSNNNNNLNMTDLRNAKGERVCSYFFRHGNCHREPCRFIHTREAVDWNANGPPAGGAFRSHNRRNGRSHPSPPNDAQSPFSSEWNSTMSASILS